MQKTEHVIAGKSITAGGKVLEKGKVVTPEIMKLTDEQFKDLVDRDLIKKQDVEKKAPPPPAGAGGSGSADALTGQERLEKIRDAIKSLFDKDGNPLKADDFTQDNPPQPKVDVLSLLLKENPGFKDGINKADRDAAMKMYNDSLNPASD